MNRLLVKFGTETLLDQARELNQGIFDQIATEIASICLSGWLTIIVTSGAIQAGREAMTRLSLPVERLHKKELAAIGSVKLMDHWQNAFLRHGFGVGQIWLTHANLEDPGERQSIGNSIKNLLLARIVPIVNENDVISDREIVSMSAGIGENDRLTALLAPIVDPTAVVSVTSVGGVFDRYPIDRESRIYRELDINELPDGLGDSGVLSKTGSGGMGRKVHELLRCCVSGRRVGIIGRQESQLKQFITGESVGTLLGRKNRF